MSAEVDTAGPSFAFWRGPWKALSRRKLSSNYQDDKDQQKGVLHQKQFQGHKDEQQVVVQQSSDSAVLRQWNRFTAQVGRKRVPQGIASMKLPNDPLYNGNHTANGHAHLEPLSRDSLKAGHGKPSTCGKDADSRVHGEPIPTNSSSSKSVGKEAASHTQLEPFALPQHSVGSGSQSSDSSLKRLQQRMRQRQKQAAAGQANAKSSK